MNFHYQAKKQRSDDLIKELLEIDKDIGIKKKQLEKTINTQSKLQAQFYDQDNRMSIADQIMNELLMKPIPSKEQPNRQFQNDSFQHLPQSRQSSNYQNSIKYLQKQKQAIPYVKQPYLKEEIQFINGQNHQKPEKNKNTFQNMRQIYPQSDKHSKDKPRMENNYVNPFIKNQAQIKEARQEKEKMYRKSLEQQLEQERKRKEAQKKLQKQQSYKYHEYVPEKVNFKKKVDPNSTEPRKITNVQQNSIQKNYMKLKIDEIKQKFKKGRIDQLQYDQSIRKIKQYYGDAFEDEQQQFIPSVPHPETNQKIAYPPQRESRTINQSRPSRQSQNYQQNYSNNINSSRPIRYNNQQQSVREQNIKKVNYYEDNYPQKNNNKVNGEALNNQVRSHPEQLTKMTKQLSELERQMMLKMFDDMRQIYKTSLLNNQKLVQQALFSGFKMPYNNQPVHSTLPTPYNQFPPSNFNNTLIYDNQQDYQNKKNLQANESLCQKNQISNIIQKSMIGIIKKIPLSQKQIQQSTQQSDLHLFFTKPYKLAKFKPFNYIEDINQSVTEISSVSNSIILKNGAELLRNSFQTDLKIHKQMQIDKQIDYMKSKYNFKKGNELSIQSKKKQKIIFSNNQVKPQKIVQKGKYIKAEQEKTHIINQQKIKQDKKEAKQNNLGSFNSGQQTINPFLKKHISQQSQEYKGHTIQYLSKPNLKPIYPQFSPRNQADILQQQEYQTQTKQAKCSKKEQINILLNNKHLTNVIKSNNEILNKYQQESILRTQSKFESAFQQESQKQSSRLHQPSIDHRQYQSIEISPVKHQQYEESLETVKSQLQSQLKSNLIYRVDQNPSFHHDLQTVESVQHSDSKFLFNRPPLLKKPRSSSRKKQTTIITHSKTNITSSLLKPPQVKNIGEDLEGSNNSDNLNICESGYEDTIGPNQSKRFTQLLQRQNNQQDSMINNNKVKINGQKEQLQKSKMSKWKSLQQARNLAKECRMKLQQQKKKESVQSQLSQLQSIITNRKEDSVLKIENEVKENKKKDIMKILSDLDDQSQQYAQQFDSYRDASSKIPEYD